MLAARRTGRLAENMMSKSSGGIWDNVSMVSMVCQVTPSSGVCYAATSSQRWNNGSTQKLIFLSGITSSRKSSNGKQ